LDKHVVRAVIEIPCCIVAVTHALMPSVSSSGFLPHGTLQLADVVVSIVPITTVSASLTRAPVGGVEYVYAWANTALLGSSTTSSYSSMKGRNIALSIYGRNDFTLSDLPSLLQSIT